MFLKLVMALLKDVRRSLTSNTIGGYAFSSLINITIPNNIAEIEDYAFPGCSLTKALKTFFLKIVNWKSKYSIIKIQ